MTRYIDAEALKKVMCEDCDNKHLCAESPACETVQQIDAQPTADVDYERGFIEGYTKAESDIFHGGKYAPVKHGRWLIGIGENGEPIGTYCSECGWSWERNIVAIQLNKIFSRIETPRCPYCGADMREAGI